MTPHPANAPGRGLVLNGFSREGETSRHEQAGRISAVRSQVSLDRTDMAIDLLYDDRSLHTARGEGHSAFAAGLNALSKAYGIPADLAGCKISQSGIDFTGEAFAEIRLSIKGEVYRGRGRGPDPVWAGLRALCDAFDKSAFVQPGNGRTEAVPTRYSKS